MAISLPLSGQRPHERAPTMRLAALRVPLVAKLVGANALVVAVFLGAWYTAVGSLSARVLVSSALVMAVHAALVVVALRPIRDLEAVASRVWNGDYGVRVDRSRVADRGALRVGSMFNILLDTLASDRAQMRSLANDVIAVGERERMAISRDLHESAAQHLAALMFQLGSTARDATDADLTDRLWAARDSAEEILEEVRSISQTVHSGVLDDLGLEAGLRKLVRRASAGNAIDFDVKVAPEAERLPRGVQSTLYHVAQEALRNTTLHASPTRVRVSVQLLDGIVCLDVHDDGRGYDLAAAIRAGSGTGLRSMRERLSLVDGQLEINTAVGNGTTVHASVPVDPASGRT